jgi:hypothetical protein
MVLRTVHIVQQAFTTRLSHEVMLACIVVAAAWLVYFYRPDIAGWIYRGTRTIAARAWIGIILAAAIPCGLRLLLLPVLPIPTPRVHDEFGHLLVADTLVHGRLANPPLSFRDHFEAIYILQSPSYASKYPIGQGAALAIGELLFGQPWFGVWISMGLMFAALCWMLYGWLPNSWAFVGGLLFGLVFCTSYWMDGYMGGAVAGTGGALVFGSVPRLFRNSYVRYGVLLAVGWSLIWLTRPFEAALLAGFGCLLLVGWLISSRNMRALLEHRYIVLAGLSVLTCTAGLTILHNWRVTGNPWLLPYQLSQKQYGVPQSFYGQPVIQEPPLPYQDLKTMYLWQREERQKMSAPGFWLRRPLADLRSMWLFFINYYFTIPLLVAIVAVKDRTFRVLIWICAAAFSISLLYPFFFVHYYAAYTAVLGLWIMLGFMKLWGYRWRGHPVGALIAGGCMVWASLVPLRYVTRESLAGVPALGPTHPRSEIARELNSLPGKHLVFVPQEQFEREWVYNGADLDTAHVVWARMLGPERDALLRERFAGRVAWSVSGDEYHPILEADEDDLHSQAGIVGFPSDSSRK